MDHSHSDVQAVEHTHKAHAAAKRIYRKGEKRICQSVLRETGEKRTEKDRQPPPELEIFPSLNHRSQQYYNTQRIGRIGISGNRSIRISWCFFYTFHLHLLYFC
jgi:hypothetical protein